MVTYYSQPCDSLADFTTQYQQSNPFAEITSGESVSSGNSLRIYSPSNASLVLTDDISVLIPPENGVYQYRLDFWMKIKARGAFNQGLLYPAVWVQTNNGRVIGGIGIQMNNASTPVIVYSLYGIQTSTGYPNILFGTYFNTNIPTDVWTHFEVVITPQWQDVYMNDVFLFRDTSSRPNLAPSKIAVMNGSYAYPDDILFDEFNINSFTTELYTLTVAPTTNGTVDGNYPPGTYSNIPAGTNITISATPSQGYRLAGWIYNGSTATTNPLQFQITKDTTVQAVFELDITPPSAPVANFAITSVNGRIACFDASSSHPTAEGASIVSYAWDFGDGYSGSGVNLCHTYASAGTYNVTLTVVDSNSLTGVVTKSVTVTEGGGEPTPPIPNFTSVPTTLIVPFDASSSYATTSGATIIDYAWDFGDGQYGTGKTITHGYAQEGTYTVKLTITDSNSLTAEMNQTLTVPSQSGGEFPWWLLLVTGGGVFGVGAIALVGKDKKKGRKKKAGKPTRASKRRR